MASRKMRLQRGYEIYMYKVGVIGESDTVAGFRALGLETFSVDSSYEAQEVLEKLIKQNFAIIYITEQIAQGIMEYIRKLKTGILPAIILFPGNKGSMGIATEEIKNAVERAVGVDILES